MTELNKKTFLDKFIFFVTWKIIRGNKDKVLNKIIIKIPSFITPDFLAYFRFLLTIILFLLFIYRRDAIFYWLATIYILGKITDWLDGSLARYRNQMTNYGEILDPLIDRLLNIVCLVIIISLWQLNSLWLFVIINIVSVILLAFDLLIILLTKITFRFKNYRKAFEVVGYLIALVLLLMEIIQKTA